MKKILVVASALALACGNAASASAAIIEYQVAGTGSGFLGGNAFNGAFTITSRGDTATRQQCVEGGVPIPSCFLVINDSIELDIAGLGQFSLINPSFTFVNNDANIGGFADIVGPMPGLINSFAFVNLIGTPSPFSTWDGVSDLAAFDTDLFLNNLFTPAVETSGGDLVFSAPPAPTPARFSASIQAAPVPEPATWAMMIAGFAMAGAALRRRKTRLKVSYS